MWRLGMKYRLNMANLNGFQKVWGPIFSILLTFQGLSTTPAIAQVTAEKPQFGFELATVVASDYVFLSNQLEYQPYFLQYFGVLGLGLSLSAADYAFTGKKYTVGFGVGGQVRYQFQYFEDQVVVPMVGYQIDFRNYDRHDGMVTEIYNNPFHSPFVGAWALLNNIDKKAARALYDQFGIKRTYFVTELRNNFGTNSKFWMANYDLYLGLRVEM